MPMSGGLPSARSAGLGGPSLLALPFPGPGLYNSTGGITDPHPAKMTAGTDIRYKLKSSVIPALGFVVPSPGDIAILDSTHKIAGELLGLKFCIEAIAQLPYIDVIIHHLGRKFRAIDVPGCLPDATERGSPSDRQPTE